MRYEVRTDRCWPSEREVAAEVPIEVDADRACGVLDSVPFWFHTFALNRGLGLYTPGAARDHGYRLASIPDSFAGLRVLDVGAFDGFYSFLAEARGAKRVLAIDNEQYVHWVRDRWEVKLEGGEGFNAIHGLLGSEIEYQRTDASVLDGSAERFDFIFCFGILHRVEDPLGLLRVLAGRLAEGGRILIETYGVRDNGGYTLDPRHVTLATVLKGLPLAYDRDLQQDKPPVFDAYDALAPALDALEGMVRTLAPFLYFGFAPH